MDQQKEKTTSDKQTRDSYSRQKDSDAPLPEERHNLVRDNNLYQHKQATNSDTKTEVAPQHTQPRQQEENDVPQKKGGTITYQQKLTTITYTKPDTEERHARPQQQKDDDIPISKEDPESTLSDEDNEPGSDNHRKVIKKNKESL